MIFFTLFYALGLGIVPWLVCSEVFASPVRAVGGGLASAVNWVANLVVSATFLDLVVRACPLWSEILTFVLFSAARGHCIRLIWNLYGRCSTSLGVHLYATT